MMKKIMVMAIVVVALAGVRVFVFQNFQNEQAKEQDVVQIASGGSEDAVIIRSADGGLIDMGKKDDGFDGGFFGSEGPVSDGLVFGGKHVDDGWDDGDTSTKGIVRIRN